MTVIISQIMSWIVSLSLSWWQALPFFTISIFGLLIGLSKNTREMILSKKRKCIDCIAIIFAITAKLDVKKTYYLAECEKLDNSLLRNQMNFAEHKLTELESKLIDFYNDSINSDHSKIVHGNEVIQFRMFWSLNKDIFQIIIKDEIRKSFKENGFEYKSGSEFASYTKGKSKHLISLIKQQIISLYPSSSIDMLVSMEQVLDHIEKIESKFEDIIFEIYIEAKRIKMEYLQKKKALSDDFKLSELEIQKNIDLLIGKK